jgi:hypothetical protein
MAHRPAFLQDGMPEADVWQEIERLGQEQGVDPSLAPVGIQAPNSAFREAITNLVAVQGAIITEEKPDEKLLRVKPRLFNAVGWAEVSLRCNTGWAK